MTDLLWPAYDGPDDLAAIEAVPLADRGLPATTYDIVTCTPNWPTASSGSSSPAPTTRPATPPLRPWTHTPSTGGSNDQPTTAAT